MADPNQINTVRFIGHHSVYTIDKEKGNKPDKKKGQLQ